MSELECPYCLELFEYDGDYDGFDQDSEHEFWCPKCKGRFFAIVYWDINFTGERKPAEQDQT